MSCTVVAHGALRRFLFRETGAVTVEFVILFPALLLFLLLVFATSLYIGTASDVQQLAQTLARASLPILNGPDPGVLCTSLADMIPGIANQSPLLRHNPSLVSCPSPEEAKEAGMVTLEVTYDLAGSTLQAVSEMLGLDFIRIERSAVVLL